MKRSFALIALLGSGFALSSAAQSLPVPESEPAAAAAPAPVGPAKIAVIAFQGAVGQTNEFQRAFGDLKKKYDPKQQQLKALSDDIEAKTKALQAQGEKLSDTERAARAKEIDDKKKQLDRSAGDAQNDFQGEMQELYSTTATKVYDVLRTYAEQHGFTLVLDIAAQQTPVLYAVPATDITKPVVEAYNVKSGVPAPPQSAAGAPAAPAPKVKAAPPAHPPAH